jgi:lipase maturation factor 1
VNSRLNKLSAAPKARVKSEYSFSSWAFQRCIGLSYLAAFGSLATQISGLIGHNGILPVENFIERSPKWLELSHFNFPLLGIFNFVGTTDATLQWSCWIGAAAALLASIGFAPPLMFIVCWVLWLSAVNIGQDFLAFQWDILLLEAGFLSIFLAPWRILDWPAGKLGRTLSAPPVVSIWLFRWLLFRLMLESGLCKLFSGDVTWRTLSAMNYHYHTQPLPTPLAWLCDKTPEVLLKSFTFATLAIESIGPFFIPIKWLNLRLVAAFCFIFLQICIALSGNYAFFNLLTFGLCLFLVDDSNWISLYGIVRKRIPRRFKLQSPRLPHRLAAIACAILVAVVSAIQFFLSSSLPPELLAARLPEPVIELVQIADRLCIVDHYGLFATMTIQRDEIILEGSSDGVTWKEYQFKYKPGDVAMPPCIVAPLQPRLDWQMWFASLNDITNSPWFALFVVRIFENSPEVLGLLGSNPFPIGPPEYLRARLYRYTFSNFHELFSTGNWWQREFKSDFLPMISRTAVLRINEQYKVPHETALPEKVQ